MCEPSVPFGLILYFLVTAIYLLTVCVLQRKSRHPKHKKVAPMKVAPITPSKPMS